MGWKQGVLTSAAALESVGWIVAAVIVGLGTTELEEDLAAAVAFIAIGWLHVTLYTLLHPPSIAPLSIITFLIAHVIFALLFLIHISLHPHPSSGLLISLILAIHVTLLSLASTSVLLLPLHSAPPPPDPSEIVMESSIEARVTAPSPEPYVSLFAWISFSWVSPLIKAGSEKKLGYEDVWKLQSTMASENVRESARALPYKRLVPRVFFNNSLDLILSLSLGLTGSFLSYSAPYFLKQILSSLTAETSESSTSRTPKASAYIYAGLALAAQLLKAEVDLQQLWHERRALIRVRSQLMGEVYEKALKRRDLSGVVTPDDPKSKSKTKDDSKKKKEEEEPQRGGGSTGKIVQLMSNDVAKVAMQLMTMSSLFAAPFELLIGIGFLYQLLGWTAIAGLSVMFISVPLNNILVKRRIKLHRAVLASRDRRMDVLNEFIQAIRFVKYSASEDSWIERVFSARTFELACLLKTRMNNLMIGIIWSVTPDLVMLVAFACFTKISHQELTVPTAFTSLALFALIRAPMNSLPNSITQILQTYVSIERLENFMAEPEVEPWVSAFRSDTSNTSHAPTTKVGIVGGKFRYQDMTTHAPSAAAVASAPSPSVVPVPVVTVDPPSEIVAPPTTAFVPGTAEEVEAERAFELRDIDVEFPEGKLSLLCGPTGSGKTSVLLALLGEMDRVEGTVHLPKGPNVVDSSGLYPGVAYASQLPWLQHASIKQNILFGSPLEDDRYAAVLDACALRPDLEMFEAGDEAEIGEKGLTLSGGQKARVALARAVYSRAKVVLLDDPLSAVDMHTARHLFRHCIKGPLLENRTVILITHHISLTLSGAAHLVQMSSGRIVLQGPVHDLDKSLITTELVEESHEGEEAVDADAPKNEADGKLTDATPEIGGKAGDQNGTPLGGPKGKLVEEEARATGRVKWKVYNAYLSAAGWENWFLILLLLLLGRGFRVLDRFWFKLWGESYDKSTSILSHLMTFQLFPVDISSDKSTQMDYATATLPHLPSARDNVNPYLLGYLAIVVGNLLISVGSILVGFRGLFRAAKKLFNETLIRVTRAPFRYYDVTPVGRILNRYSTDFSTIDMSLTDQVRTCLTQAFSFIVNVGVIVVVSPSFIPPALVMIYLYVQLALSYVRCSRDLRRLESNARSPIYSKFGETLQGIVTCRAFGAERRFLGGLFESLDTMLAAMYSGAMCNRFLLWRFDFLGATGVAAVTFLVLFSNASAGTAALAITSAQSLVQAVYWLCRYISALEVDLNAVERVTELLNVPQEPPQVIETYRPPAYWPSDKSGIVVENLVLAYAPTLPPVIKNVSFEIKPREKVGLVGRTGSGKSTMALALLRIVDPSSGHIFIDGLDIVKLGLKDLRSALTLIPQEAVLFSGTLRSNLDPFDEHTDEELRDALERVQLVFNSNSGTATPLLASGYNSDAEGSSQGTRVEGLGRQNVKLDMPVSAGGNNFSAGQRQLLAMARALLRRSRIIIMDEATASVDFATDTKIQRTIQEEFADSTVLTIAHRLRTVIDYDRILVLDKGALVEFDTPRALLQKEGGVFRLMCEQASDYQELKTAAGLQ
ncbi:P-loop containing nucleoside triphosphate hydrolase protein [Meredithblackwellia eburnea MCA 4105]